MNRPTVALAMIVKNEEKNLPALFKSIEGCFDAVYITDTGSTDRTVELAKSFGANVHHFEWIKDFSAARNASFAPVKEDFTVWLDADDSLENPEGFKLFRDTAMGLADFHMVPYHYTSDASGKATCTFARERVFRTDRKFKWKYPIHEGVMPDTPYGPARVAVSPSWAVRHRRTEQDIIADRGRNIGVFESYMKTNKLDARMQYYYGKELFEAGKPIEAIEALKRVLCERDLEMHDRILAYQYICYAYMQCNQFEQALTLAMQGIVIAPQRAEFFIIIGDSFRKLKRDADAVPFYSAAKGCRVSIPQGFAGPIFHHEESYTSFPMNQIASIAAITGNLDAAEKESEEAARLYGHADSVAILAEVRRIKSAIVSFDNAPPCDDIVFTTAPQNAYTFDPGVAAVKSMGGSETALIEMARHLATLSGRKVIVFNMRDKDETFDGVEYRNNVGVHEYFKTHKPYFHVAWRHSIKLTDAPTFIWCHDLQTQGIENHTQYVKAMALTPFHRNYMRATQLVPDDKIMLTRNGIRPERFQEVAKSPKDPFRFVFGSSPDRGLDRAMRVLDRVRIKYPAITLHVHYGIEHLPRWGHQVLHDKLKVMFAERPWVTYHGATQQDALMESYKRSSYCVQPSDWIETSCISVMELAGCGVYPIFRAVGGVCDTLAPFVANNQAKLVHSDCITESEHDIYAQAVITAIEEQRFDTPALDMDQFSWEGVARQWLEEIPAIIETKSEVAIA